MIGANEIIYWPTQKAQEKDLPKMNLVEQERVKRLFPPKQSAQLTQTSKETPNLRYQSKDAGCPSIGSDQMAVTCN